MRLAKSYDPKNIFVTFAPTSVGHKGKRDEMGSQNNRRNNRGGTPPAFIEEDRRNSCQFASEPSAFWGSMAGRSMLSMIFIILDVAVLPLGVFGIGHMLLDGLAIEPRLPRNWVSFGCAKVPGNTNVSALVVRYFTLCIPKVLVSTWLRLVDLARRKVRGLWKG